jgi:cyclin-dependent kinase regulatory subunit CKS1
MNETEWRSLGIQQSKGWIHYTIHKPEPHILLFRRELSKKI